METKIKGKLVIPFFLYLCYNEYGDNMANKDLNRDKEYEINDPNFDDIEVIESTEFEIVDLRNIPVVEEIEND